MSLVQTDNKNFVRDMSSNALINTNIEELRLLKAQREKELGRDSEILSLKQELEYLKKLVLSMER
jgi:hypothetical protein